MFKKRSEIKENTNFLPKKIGIPRSFSYYNNFPFYYGFFKALGFEVVISDKTTNKIINDGSSVLVSDSCFPLKVYVGHLLNLLEKGVETIFVPSLQSVDYKINNCSKIRGLPEIIRNVIDIPFNMIEPTLDKTEGIGFYDFWTSALEPFGITDKETIRKATKSGWEMYDNFLEMTHSGIDYKLALSTALEGRKITNAQKNDGYWLSVAIMGHGYNLFDERISLNLLEKLDKMKVKVYTSLQVSASEAKQAIESLGEIQYWANEFELTGTAAHYMKPEHRVDGIIALSAFGCGPDSLMVDEISYHAKRIQMPLLHLTIDEHTGEAGFMTRLDAFVDMLWRKKRMNIVKNIHDLDAVTSQNIKTKEPKQTKFSQGITKF
ncbi:hypothetical protein IKQ26_06875 [bacterium]|nr:hypothetical protein [bacterium]